MKESFHITLKCSVSKMIRYDFFIRYEELSLVKLL